MKNPEKMIFGKDYKDLDKFLDTMYRRIRFFTPFTYPTLKNSPWKMCAILSVILISPIPNCILIYEQNDENFALKLLQFSEMILIISAETMSFITVAYVARNLESIHRKVNFIHAIFRRKNAPIYSSSCHVKHDLSFLLMILLYMTPQLVYKWITNSNEHKGNQILEWLSTAIPVVVVHQLASIFRLVISILSVQLSNLNQLLKTADPRKPQEIEFLVYGHCLINQTFKLLNSSFAIPMIAMSFCTFFIVVYNFYDMLTFNSTQEISQTIGDNLGGITWIIMWTSELIVVVVLLEKLNERYEGFTEVLHYIVINDRTGILSRSPKIQMHFAMRQKLECTAGGFFTVDYRLLSTMVSSATTYLIILIQVAQVSLEKQ